VRRFPRIAGRAPATGVAGPIGAPASSGLARWPAAAPSARLVAGRYRLRALLGRGGMGRVWLAEDELLHRPVALKQLVLRDAESAKTGGAPQTRALDEARAAARVNHDGAVRILDVVREDDLPWIVMEPLSGRTLAETLEAEGPLSIGQVTHVGLRLLDTLEAIHQAGIVHCDIKPANVHVCADGRVVLVDFGIACVADADSDGPTCAFAGTPAYTSPEQIRGRRPEPASDLFSLGATLYAAVEGKDPFDKGDLLATSISVIEDPPPPFVHAGPLRPVIAGLLVKDPGRRLTARQSREALLKVRRRPCSRWRQ
jgi:serine/threonine protein kinase